MTQRSAFRPSPTRQFMIWGTPNHKLAQLCTSGISFLLNYLIENQALVPLNSYC